METTNRDLGIDMDPSGTNDDDADAGTVVVEKDKDLLRWWNSGEQGRSRHPATDEDLLNEGSGWSEPTEIDARPRVRARPSRPWSGLPSGSSHARPRSPRAPRSVGRYGRRTGSRRSGCGGHERVGADPPHVVDHARRAGP